MKSFYDKLNAGDYTSVLPYPSFGRVNSKEEQEVVKAMKVAYNEDEDRLLNLFKSDLADYHEVAGNPKFERCFSIAWELGHSSGFHEIANYFADIVDLIK